MRSPSPSEEKNFDLAKLIFIRVWYVQSDQINFISLLLIFIRVRYMHADPINWIVSLLSNYEDFVLIPTHVE